MNRSEYYAQAMAALRRSRQRAITLADQNKQIAYDRIPRLLVLDNLTIETSLARGRLGAAQAPDEKIEEKKAALAAMEEELAHSRENVRATCDTEAALREAKKYDCTIAILKERSPSCGSNGIYDGTFSHKLREGMGKTAALLAGYGLKVYGESRLKELEAVINSGELT